MNATLRSEQRKNLVPWFLYLRLILTALARLPSKRHSVFRGAKENLWLDYPTGQIFIWWGFSSCTSSIEVLENEQFFGKTGNRTLFQIHSTTGNGLHIVQLKEIKPQYDLLEPVPVPNLSVQPKKSLQGKSTTITGAMGGQFAAMQLQLQTKSK
ncbi:unnamed protein product, partial [Rotaria magnacalcarata]